MQLFHRFFYFLLFYVHIISATEYVYPVAYLKDNKTILYVHQQTPTNIELYEWHIDTNQINSMLWSVFNPANVQLLPNNEGFSFIDNGRLRIKMFQKRSAKAIDFDEPLFNINTLHWINDDSCYCSAQCDNYFRIFELHTDGTSRCLITSNNKDCMYPQKINESLFFIERCKENDIAHYRIMQDSELIMDFEEIPIVFLTMQSKKEGFVIEHAQSIDSNSLTMQFWCHHIVKKNGAWLKKRLFSFFIPTSLLLPGEQQLYESLLPLLPRRANEKIYFVDCINNKDFWLEPYFYDLSSHLINKLVVSAKKGHYFTPMPCGKQIYCGGTGNEPPLGLFFT